MASPHTSEPDWWFIDVGGNPLDRPVEWTPGFIEIDTPPDLWVEAEARVQGSSIPAQARRFGTEGRVVVPWPRSGAGRYRIAVSVAEATSTRTVVISPAKITQSELETMVIDLETELAPTIALSLQRMGAFTGLRIAPPGVATLAAEMERLRVAVDGDHSTTGLRALLIQIARDPHKMLHTEEPWVPRNAARRPSPTRLGAAFAKADNLDDDRLPRSLADQRVRHSVDVYENRLLKLFAARVIAKSRRLRAVAAGTGNAGIADEAAALGYRLMVAARQAPFLSEVSLPSHGPSQVSMVLQKRPEYRAMLAAYQRYHRYSTAVIDDPVLDAPLADVPALYELWGTLQVARSLVVAAEALGFEVAQNELVRRRADDLRLVTRGAVVRLRHPGSGVTVRFREQPRYGANPKGLHSITFQQVPDITIEITRGTAGPEVFLFDPKYKLQSPGNVVPEGEEAEIFPGGPQKVDIDKMHAYRDAIRHPSGERAVRYAAILYPGESRTFAPGLEAVECRPGRSEELRHHLEDSIGRWLEESITADSQHIVRQSESNVYS